MKPLRRALVVTSIVSVSLVLQAQQPPPDTILTNGKIITVDETFSIAQAVAVRGSRIVGVGTTQEITALAGPNTRRIDLRGRSVVPGLIDNHAHFQEEGEYWILETRLDGVATRKGPVPGSTRWAAGRPISSKTTRSSSRATSWTSTCRTIPCSCSSRASRPISTVEPSR
jgi:urease alpha subunit